MPEANVRNRKLGVGRPETFFGEAPGLVGKASQGRGTHTVMPKASQGRGTHTVMLKASQGRGTHTVMLKAS
jgi:hypothetical protein